MKNLSKNAVFLKISNREDKKERINYKVLLMAIKSNLEEALLATNVL